MKALVLAGGENRRFMSHKALAEVNGRRIIETAAGMLAKQFDQVWLSTNEPELFFYLGLPMVGDLISVKGPMTGIYSGLVMTGADELFVVACDMPFISEGLLEMMKSRYAGEDALIPVCNSRPEPLIGIYSARLREVMREHILQDRRSLQSLIRSISAVFLDERSVRTADPDCRSFININTPDEYRHLTAGA